MAENEEPKSSLYYMDNIECRLDSIETPALVALYRPLISRCVKVDDVVFYLDDVINTEEREEIIAIKARKGSTKAMKVLLSFIDRSEANDKWTKFVEILDKKGYQYVAKALRGEKVNSDVYKKYINLLSPLRMDLVEKINPNDLLDLLESQEKVIEQSDTEHIKAEMENNGPMAGMIVLLDRIWRKSENWYTSFLKVLCLKEYTYFVERLDRQFALDEETKNTEGSFPVQCVSDEEEYRLAESGNFNELFSGDFHGEKPIQAVVNNVGDKDGVEDTEAKSVIETEETEVDTDLKRTYQNASAEEQNHVSEEDVQTSLGAFEERQYQNELALPAQRGQNCIIIAPTGSGKTFVAVKIIKHHLENREIQREKKIAFVVEKNNLATQQSETINRHVTCKLKVVSGDTMRDEDFKDLAVLLSQFDVFVITAQMLVNAMDKRNLRIESFSLIIFDECHHCHGGHSFYKTMIPYHDKKLEDPEERIILPQIVGFTASIGVGKANTQGQVVNHIKTMMANLDADALVSVKENYFELVTKMNTPDNTILKIPKRKIDQFGAIIKDLMVKTEDCLALANDKLPDKNALSPPSTKGNEEYTQWLQTSLMDAGVRADRDLSPFLFTIRKYLEIYNEALIIHSNARASDALCYILQNIQDLQISDTGTEIEIRAKTLFENVREELNICATDDQKCEENPLLMKLKEIILETHREESNMRGIVFVRTRVVADIIASWMKETDELKQIKARKYTGAQARGTDGGSTKSKQRETIELFTKGDFKVIVATTIAEEGLDIEECNLVVKYDYAGNLISQIQAKGRGRAVNSRFFILASENKCVAERELTNSLQEPMMEEAMNFVQQEIQAENEKYQMEKQELQRQAKRERDAAVHNQSSRTNAQRQCVLRCLKCNQYLCLSNELKKIGSHFACVSEKLKNHVTCEKSEDIIFENKKIKIGVGIVKCKCGEKIGNVALHRGIHFPMLQIKAIKIEDDKKELCRLKQWKKVEEEYFTVSPLSTRDFKRISESGKLVDMD
uniref:RNA helicase n=1 Tax=Magallana gigas TaxID=29159 RepID=K1QJL0_MAGGI|nr:probable ATP-dependent RNA helicase DHX58 [Crassostrea gigas]AGQ42556.1 retinoic acid-inducible protein 1 [Crassostrea gigas]|eukprot:NP_001292234.1 probable ATP-dependent RNA helicase DHX58 [Crassostrea gigas]